MSHVSHAQFSAESVGHTTNMWKKVIGDDETKNNVFL